jgi:hypothetical protein
MVGSGKKFQASATKSWQMRGLGESLKEASRTARVPKKAVLTTDKSYTIGQKVSSANASGTSALLRPRSLKVKPTKFSSTHLYVKDASKLIPGGLPRSAGAVGSKRIPR